MIVSNKNITTFYVIFIMFLPNTMYIVDQPGLPLISFKRMYIAVWVVFFIASIIINRSINGQITQLPFYRGCLYITLLLGFVTAATFKNNPIAIPGYLSFILETIFPVFMVWIVFKDSDSVLRVIKILVYVYTLVALYGVFAYLYDSNPLLELLVSEDSSRKLLFTYDSNERAGIEGRAQSFFAHPLHLGYISSVIMVMVFGVQKGFKLFPIIIYLSILFVLMLSVMLAGSRSPILLLIISMFVYAVYSGWVSYFKIFLISVLVLVFIIGSGMHESILGNRLVLITSIFEDFLTGDSGLGGSSIDMRLSQLAAAINIFLDSPIYGHGMGYIRTVIENRLAPGLLRGESFAFKIIDIGVIGMIGYFLLYKGIYSSFMHYRRGTHLKNIKMMAGVGVALLGGHLSFIFATGEMGMVFIYLILTTLLLRLMYLSIMDSMHFMSAN